MMKAIKLLFFFFLFSAFYSIHSIASAEITTGLVGYWNFDEGSGTIANDSSGNGNIGTIRGGASWTSGKTLGALNFDGVDDYVTIPNNVLLNMGTGDFTINAWINTNNNTNLQYIFYKFNSSPQTGYAFKINPTTGFPSLWVGDGVNTLSYKAGSIKINDGQWHNVAVKFIHGQKIQFFVDGVLDPSEHNASLVAGSIDNVGDSRIGTFGGNYFNGLIDEVRVYNRALASSEILDLYSGSKPSITSGEAQNVATSSAVLWGEVNSKNIPTSAWFEYGTASGSYGSQSSVMSLNNSTSSPVNIQITGLSPATEYYFRLTAQNSEGISYGIEKKFTTLAPPLPDMIPPSIKIISPTSNLGLSNGLMAHYKFDENSGSEAIDSSGNSNNGTISGAMRTSGKIGKALSFNGTNNYMSTPIFNYDEISVSAWFYKNSNDTTNADTILGGWEWNWDTQLEEGFDFGRFFQSSPDVFEFVVITKNSGGVKTDKRISYKFINSSVGVWHHAVGTYNKTTGEQALYVDGVLASLANHPAGNTIVSYTRNADMRIGYSRVNNGYFNGVIDDIRIYNRPLSNEEAKSLYDNSAPEYITENSTVNLSGTASDNVSLASVEWINDRGGSGSSIGTDTWSIPNINLFYGVNNITITAKDYSNNQVQGRIKIVYKKPGRYPSSWPWRGINITNASSTPSDIAYLKNKLGVNSVFLRLMTRTMAERNKLSPEVAWQNGIDWLDSMLDAARDNGIVAHIGTDDFPIDSSLGLSELSAEFWNNPAHLDKTIELIGRFADHFKSRGSEVGSYSFLSEPTITVGEMSITPPQWSDFRNRIINKIREFDKERWIEVSPGPGGQASGYKTMELLNDEKIIYNAHMFDPHTFTHQGVGGRGLGYIYPDLVLFNKTWDKEGIRSSFDYLKSFQNKYGVPVSIGSFGVVRWATGGEQYLQDFTDILDEYKWSWSYWSYKNWHGWDPWYNSQYPTNNNWQSQYLGESSARWTELKKMFASKISSSSQLSSTSGGSGGGSNGGNSAPGSINPGISAPNSGVATTTATATSAIIIATTTPTPVFEASSTYDVDERVSNTQSLFIKSLKLKSEGEEVKKLQEFLSHDKEIYPEGLITGYFGHLTREAVQRFQCKHNIICSGDEKTTGYGIVGPKTIAKLNGLTAVGNQTPETTASSTYDAGEASQNKEFLIIQLKQQVIELMMKVIEMLSKKQNVS